ncbi:zinc ribbon domain-containing protein [Litorimonas sp. WD9-15]|uniref:zinc ribbon domain-containing protein n=1 Tax=Litorimonas sp. WD9-15 TaxID=3418716 RepID=UPI003D00BB4F
MAKSTRRPQQLYSIVMWILSVIFAGFLIGLGGLVIKDLPRMDRTIMVEDFIDADKLQALRGEERQLENQLTPLRRASEDAFEAQTSARADYRSAKSNFDNWISTRTATESAATNPEVLRRTRELETLAARSRTSERLVADAQTALREREREVADIRSDIQTLRSEAQPQYRSAIRSRDLRVFGFRLMLTLPLLLAAAWMIAKKRGSAYWPLYRGFVLFSLFAFFVELVPYLPSYGGYVRYTVGIIAVAVAGYFLIKQMRKYLARKQLEEARSEAERRKSIDYETALKKIAAKTCPGCDRSIVTRDGVNTDYCVHCGIHLQRQCPSCDTRNVTFYRYCLCCGTENEELVKPNAVPPTPA